MEVPPDDPALVADPARLPTNQKRLRFYEQYGAFPIAGTKYETVPPDQPAYDPPYLVYDPLGHAAPLRRADAQRVVEGILQRKYHWDPQSPYVREVVQSFVDDPVRLRPPQYTNHSNWKKPPHGRLRPLKVVIAEKHDIHHVRERGYLERPARVGSIMKGLEDLPVERFVARKFGEKAIRAVHAGDFVSYLREATNQLGPHETIYPYIFPIRRPNRKPRDLAIRAGYYCIDTFTPLSQAAYRAARAAVDCALTGAELILQGQHLVYSLCRPPGHHAERRTYGGFCYFANAAIAAHRLSQKGKVALLDIDYHHGNGSQDIFYERDDVLVSSLHGHPNHSYPYFCGFADERGEGAGRGFNRNLPLPEGTTDAQYLSALDAALKEIREFRPMFLVVSVGFDIMRGDPTGSFLLTPQGMQQIGERLAKLDLPALIVQEGGYSRRNLVRGAQAFFSGLCRGWYW
jgi:acetoin utilization deacetylase AcuC-like enzyme